MTPIMLDTAGRHDIMAWPYMTPIMVDTVGRHDAMVWPHRIGSEEISRTRNEVNARVGRKKRRLNKAV